MTETLEDIARDIAREEHRSLEFRRECLDPRGYAIEDFDYQWQFREDFEDYFDRNQLYFLEEAREIVAREAL